MISIKDLLWLLCRELTAEGENGGRDDTIEEKSHYIIGQGLEMDAHQCNLG